MSETFLHDWAVLVIQTCYLYFCNIFISAYSMGMTSFILSDSRSENRKLDCMGLNIDDITH